LAFFPIRSSSVDILVAGLAPYDESVVFFGISRKAIDNDAQLVDEVQLARGSHQLNEVSSQKFSHLTVFNAIYIQSLPSWNVYRPFKVPPLSNCDPISIPGHQCLQTTDFRIVISPQDNSFLLISPKEVYSVHQRDANDRIEWFLEHQFDEEAMQLSLQEVKNQNTVLKDEFFPVKIGQKLMADLFHRKEFSKAANLCPFVCDNDVEAWEKWIFVFLDQNQLEVIWLYGYFADVSVLNDIVANAQNREHSAPLPHNPSFKSYVKPCSI
jgi:hypothetical protein